MDKRRHVRAPCNSKVIMIVNDRVDVRFIRNLSMSGIFIETVDNYNIGDTVFMLFPLHHTEKTAKVSGCVVRIVTSTPNNDVIIPGIGLEFTDKSFDFSVLVEDYVIRIKNIYEEISILMDLKKPDTKRLGILLKKANMSDYNDYFELREKIKRDCMSLGIFKQATEE